MPTSDEVRGFEPVATKAGEKIDLAMQKLFLMGRILPIGARLVVQHSFQCDSTKPKEEAASCRFTMSNLQRP